MAGRGSKRRLAGGVGHNDALKFLAELQAAIAPPPDIPPQGFFSSDQWAEKWRISEVHARRILRLGFKLGKVERIKCRMPAGNTFGFFYKPAR